MDNAGRRAVLRHAGVVLWWAVAQAQAGVVSREQLVRAGRTSTTVDRMSARGELVRLCRGVYLAGGAPLTFQARLWAGALATDGIIGYATAAYLWGVLDHESNEVHLVLPHSRRIAAPPGTVLHRVPVPLTARTVRSGLPVTTRAWSVLDLLASLPSSAAGRLADRAMQRRWITDRDLRDRLRDQPCRTGNAQLRRLQALVTDGAAAESERVLHRLLRRAGVSGWRPNHEVWADGDLVAVVDVALPGSKTAIEVDGMAFHIDVDRFRGDRHRQNALVALGWTVIRFTWSDLIDRPGYVVAILSRFGSVTARQRA